MTKTLEMLHDFVWGAPALVLTIGVGLYLSIRTGFAQFRLFPAAVRTFVRRFRPGSGGETGISPFQALCTALAATAGTGNLVGVAGAICIGGPGSIFWMWLCGLLGMATKYAEAALAVRYRVREGSEYLGGPMYMICHGMGEKWRWMGCVYSFFGIFAAFGVGNATQINSVISGVNGVLCRFGGGETPTGNLIMGIFLALLVGAMLLGGAKRIGQTAERLVPAVSAGYILLCVGVLLLRLDRVPGAFCLIFEGALSPRAATGGILGSAFQALRVGCSRGVFTNEAGMGTAAIAHGSAEVNHPAEQGMMGILEVFLDTILICTLTALVILCSGVTIPYGSDVGGELTTQAFTSVWGDWVSVLLAGALCCFAFATILGWGLYGIRCAGFLFGHRGMKLFALLQTVTVAVSAVLKTETVWLLAETVNGLMALPNLIALAYLSPELIRLTREYTKRTGTKPVEVTYADFHQCKPLRTFSHEKVPSPGRCCKKEGQEDLSSEHRPARSAHP